MTETVAQSAAPACAAGSGSARRGLFVATILVGSFLLFLVQPMVARMALPRLGGAPNVWNSAMLVYQALLLAGYGYAHLLGKLPLRRQAAIHLVALVLAGLTLPVGLVALPPAAPGAEVLWVPLLLGLSIGPVFFVVSAQAPLMQRWYAADPRAGEPWALYAASNLGSFAGLLAYPLLAEPLLTLHQQSLLWTAGFVLLIALVATVAATRRAVDRTSVADVPQAPAGAAIGWRIIALWLLLSAVPSGLMLSTTTHLTTDIFAMPLLWVIPLGLYLLSFVFAFAEKRGFARFASLLAPATVLLAGGFAMVSEGGNAMTMALASTALLFVLAVTLHARLYDLRPDASRLTLFYFVMSAGGALGGAFTALIAPVAFDWTWEHPLLILAAALLLPVQPRLDWRRLKGLEPGMARLGFAVLCVAALFLCRQVFNATFEDDNGTAIALLSLAVTAVGVLLLPWRPAWFALLVVLMLAQGGTQTIRMTIDGARTRSYFGIYTVRRFDEQHVRTLAHGTTLHGKQSTLPGEELAPTTYYGDSAGVGLALDAAPGMFGPHARIGIVGLGTGTLACRHRAGQDWTFFEIDPVIEAYSQRGDFTFMQACAPQARVVIGDARLDLEKVPSGRFDVLVIDAFSSDAIPLHLLTDEAVATYERALAPGGLLLIHISNRFIDLEPVLSAIARKRGLTARVRLDVPGDSRLLVPSKWVVLARDPQRIGQLAARRPEQPWKALKQPVGRVWTDDYASILPFIRWHNMVGFQ